MAGRGFEIVTNACRCSRVVSTSTIGTAPRAARWRGPAAQHGIALVLALWAGALLGIISVAFAFAIRSDSTTIGDAGGRYQAEALADSALNRALLGLLSADPTRRWRADGRVYETPFEGGLLRASIRAEAGKIDINAAPQRLVEGLIATADDGTLVDPAALAAAILDWRDPDSHTRPLGAENPEYRAAGLEHGAGDRAFLSVDELGRVLGMPRALLERLRTVVTVHTGTPRIDPLTAPRLALLAVPGLDPEKADAFLIERRRLLGREPALPGASDPLPLHLLAGGQDHLSSTRIRVYTVLTEGRTRDGTAAWRQALVRIDPNVHRPYRLLTWTDDPIAVEPLFADSTAEN